MYPSLGTPNLKQSCFWLQNPPSQISAYATACNRVPLSNFIAIILSLKAVVSNLFLYGGTLLSCLNFRGTPIISINNNHVYHYAPMLSERNYVREHKIRKSRLLFTLFV